MMKSSIQYSPSGRSPKRKGRSYSRSSRSGSYSSHSGSSVSKSPTPKRRSHRRHESSVKKSSAYDRDSRYTSSSRGDSSKDYKVYRTNEKSSRQGESSSRRRVGYGEDPAERERRNKGLKPGQEFAYFKRRETPDEDIPDTIEERDLRTVFVWQLSARIRPRDLDEFFSVVGKVRDVRLILDTRTQRSKGIAYVEFFHRDSVLKAVRLTGTKLLGAPIQVQMSQAEKNRSGTTTHFATIGTESFNYADNLPMKLYVGSLHYNITDNMIRGIFESFGKIDEVKLVRDPVSNQSHGYAFVHFARGMDAKKAMEQMNGYELAGRAIKVNYVLERTEANVSERSLDIDEVDRTGLNLGSTGRLALMAKLAEGTGLTLPKATQNALAMAATSQPLNTNLTSSAIIIPTTCLLLSNMFDTRENPPLDEIRDDVLDECSQLGPVVHIHVDRSPSSRGSVYVKMATIAAAAMCVNKLNGRFFSGRVISAEFFSVSEYNKLFPDSLIKRVAT